MRSAGPWSVFGVEINQRVAFQAREHYGLEILPVALEEASFAPNSFDAVTMWDVLEHVHDPAATLNEIHRILKPGGVLVVRVPNLDSWDAALFGDYWAGLDAPRHLYVYTPETLSRTLNQSGFHVVEHSAQIGGYVTFALSVRFWMTAHEISPKVGAFVTRALYNPLSRLLSAPIFYIPSLLRKGPLLVTTSIKPG
jgi:predicted SAM-dependent methyltransferase